MTIQRTVSFPFFFECPVLRRGAAYTYIKHGTRVARSNLTRTVPTSPTQASPASDSLPPPPPHPPSSLERRPDDYDSKQAASPHLASSASLNSTTTTPTATVVTLVGPRAGSPIPLLDPPPRRWTRAACPFLPFPSSPKTMTSSSVVEPTATDSSCEVMQCRSRCRKTGTSFLMPSTRK